MRRVVAIVVVVALHVGLIAMFATSRVARHQEESHEPRIRVVWLSPSSPASASIESDPKRFPGGPPPILLSPPRSADLNPPATRRSTGITPQLDDLEEHVPPPPPRIDWASEARLAASRAGDSLEEQRRRAAAFAAPDAPRTLKKPPPPAPEFGWSKAHTQRIQPLPEGGTLIRINDRCALVLYVGLFPVCQIGKIEARGDLFEHMRDPNEPEE